jgi:hypothetical protein
MSTRILLISFGGYSLPTILIVVGEPDNPCTLAPIQEV